MMAPKAAATISAMAKAISGCTWQPHDQNRDQHGGKADDGPHAEVDPARQDDEGHAHRGDAEEGVVGKEDAAPRVDSIAGCCDTASV